ncbi:MAG TPA: pilus assembly protein N-terminal domain-containing protein [Vicinamibacterales bacterium]
MRTIRPLILIIAVFGTAVMRAQSPLPVTAVAASRSDAVADTDTRSVHLLVGRSTLVDVTSPISRVSLTSSDVADALVTSPNQLLVNGKIPGTISMFVWDRSGTIRRYEVVVQRDLARLAEQVRQLFPGDQIDVQSNGRDVVLSGSVSNKDVIEKAINVAAGYVDKREEVVTLLQVRDSGASNQVLLRVRFAEVSRSAMTDLGISLFTGPNGYQNVLGRVTTDQVPAPTFDTSSPGQNKLVFSDFLNLFFFDTKNQLGAVIKALQTKGLFQSLAEPNLIAESGKEASFLAGGEIPVPIAQGSGSAMAISVQYKEFGIRLSFTPVVNGNRIHIKVKPEVSALDFTNAVVLNGFRIPALTTRRTETEVELDNGQTFAIAGLMNNTVNSQLQKIPGIGDIPILGLLFQSKSAQKNQSELVVMITPEILPKSSHGVTNTLPRMPEQMLPPLPEKKSVPMPPPAFTAVTSAEVVPPSAPTPKPAPQPAAMAQPPMPTPAGAAATINALLPTTAPRAVAEPVASQPPAAAPVSAPQNADAQAPAPSQPLTDKQKAALTKTQQKEQEAAAKASAKAAEDQREADKKQKKEQEKADKEQAKRDAEAAKQGAELAKRQAEYDKQQAEQDKKQQKVIADAEARAKAADAAYQNELSKAKKQQ